MVETINIAVNSDHPYSYYSRKLHEARVLKSGEPGNCTDISMRKQELARHGIHSSLFVCNLKDGQGHAFLTLEGGRADNRFDEVVPFSEVGCRR